MRLDSEDFVLSVAVIGIAILGLTVAGAITYSIYEGFQPIETKQINQYCFEMKQGRSYSIKCVNSTNVNVGKD